MKDQTYVTITNNEYQALKCKKGLYKVIQEIRFHDYDDPERCFDITFYYKDEKLHRVNGPAITNGNGFKGYYQEGVLHNLIGPAIIKEDGIIRYYIKGDSISMGRFMKKLSKNNLKRFILNSENFLQTS